MIKNYSSFLLTRLAIGASMLGHGLVRLPKLNEFSDGVVEQFKNSILPDFLVLPFSYLIPLSEFAIGIFLILGLFTKEFLAAGCVLMILLISGSALIENWNAITTQLIHFAFFSILLSNLTYNKFGLDHLRKKPSAI